jgi:hypothetical protein
MRQFLQSMLFCYVALVSACFHKSLSTQTRVCLLSKNVTFYYPRINIRDSFPVQWPEIVVFFEGRPQDVDVEVLESMGASLEKVPGRKGDTYIVKNPSLEDLENITGMTRLSKAFVAPQGQISADSVLTLVGLVTRIQAAGDVVNMIYAARQYARENLVSFGLPDGDTDTWNVAGGRVVPLDQQAEGMEVEEGEVATVEMDLIGGKVDDVVLAVDQSVAHPHVCFGSASDIPGGESGILIPFETNYSQIDPCAIQSFLKSFMTLCVTDPSEADTEVAEYITAWTKAISRTSLGEQMAHMMATLDIAVSAKCGIYFLFREDGRYDGTVLLGDHVSLKQPGVELYTALSPDVLKRDVEEYGFHSTAVRGVLTAIQSEVQLNEITTLRQLRELVWEDGEPAGLIKNQIGKLLPKIAFAEKPLPVHPGSLEQILQLLAQPPDSPIPNNLYLHRDDFFSTDRDCLVLSAFGQRVPSFMYGATKIRATSVNVPGMASLPPYNPVPPNTLQIQFLPMRTALPQWQALLRSGVVNLEIQSKLPGSRVFAGEMKSRTWNLLNTHLTQSIENRKTVTTTVTYTGELGQKRKGSDDEGDTKRKKKSLLFG